VAAAAAHLRPWPTACKAACKSHGGVLRSSWILLSELLCRKGVVPDIAYQHTGDQRPTSAVSRRCSRIALAMSAHGSLACAPTAKQYYFSGPRISSFGSGSSSSSTAGGPSLLDGVMSSIYVGMSSDTSRSPGDQAVSSAGSISMRSDSNGGDLSVSGVKRASRHSRDSGGACQRVLRCELRRHRRALRRLSSISFVSWNFHMPSAASLRAVLRRSPSSSFWRWFVPCLWGNPRAAAPQERRSMTKAYFSSNPVASSMQVVSLPPYAFGSHHETSL
jgi:hypothetical protein